MIEQLVEILYFLSSGLLAPTLALLILFLALTFVMLGGLAREACERRIYSRSWLNFVHGLRSGKVSDELFFDLQLIGYPARFQSRIKGLNSQDHIVQKCLEDIELDMTRRLSRLTFGARLGPMLGLVGTLVPLGPALTGLAAGDVEALSGNLVIAFTTTVFGILIGGLAYAASVLRRGWYEQDLSDLEFVAGFWNSSWCSTRSTQTPRNGQHLLTATVVPQPIENDEQE